MRMTKFNGLVISFVILILSLMLLPITVSATEDAITDQQLDTFNGAVVAGGETTVTLTEDLWRGVEASVVAMTASGAGAVPAFDGYVVATNALTIDGLGVDTPQNITVTYLYDANVAYAGVSSLTGFVPLLVTVGLIIVAVINGIWALRMN